MGTGGHWDVLGALGWDLMTLGGTGVTPPSPSPPAELEKQKGVAGARGGGPPREALNGLSRSSVEENFGEGLKRSALSSSLRDLSDGGELGAGGGRGHVGGGGGGLVGVGVIGNGFGGAAGGGLESLRGIWDHLGGLGSVRGGFAVTEVGSWGHLGGIWGPWKAFGVTSEGLW